MPARDILNGVRVAIRSDTYQSRGGEIKGFRIGIFLTLGQRSYIQLISKSLT